MQVILKAQVFDPYAELGTFERARFVSSGQFGAMASFVGTMRDYNDGSAVRSMMLEHYPGMTERHLEEICAQACAKWPLLDTLIIHRVGEVLPGEAIVLVAVWSGHRAEAFEACRFIMEDLKSHAPFWKKEQLSDRARWVATNTPGTIESARER